MYLKIMTVFMCSVLVVSCQTAKPVATEHGWKTSRVIATRYQNDLVGYNIGFDFPLNRYDSDRVEVSDFMESKGGWIYEGGGYPGATAYATFDGVKDKESADRKLLAILPELDKLMHDISSGKPIHIIRVNRQRPSEKP